MLRAQELLSAKRESEDKKKAQDFILFWRGQNRPNPESRDERPPGNHPGREGKWSKGMRKIKIICAERDLQGAQLHVIQSARQRKIIFLFDTKGEKKDRERT